MQSRSVSRGTVWAVVLFLCGCTVLSALKPPEIPESHSEFRDGRLSLYAPVNPGSFEIVLIQLDTRMHQFSPEPKYYDGQHLLNPVTRPATYDAVTKQVRYTFTPAEMALFYDDLVSVHYQWTITYKLPNGNDTAFVYSPIFLTRPKEAKEQPGTNNTIILP